jgi:phenylacetic acid degradation operon negative regulatory protein
MAVGPSRKPPNIYHDSIESANRSVVLQDPVEPGEPTSLIRDAALAPVLGARKDGRENADSAGSLLLTLLGELVRPTGRAAWTQSLVEASGLLGVGHKAARQAISRLRDRGWLVSERVGRRTRWEFTPSLGRLLDDGAERIYGFGQDEPEWDGRWLIVLASISQSQRRLRYRMTVGLTWAGFGSPAPGVWISPWVDRETEARQVLGSLGVEGATSFRAELGTLGDRGDMVARSWDLDALGERYRRLLAEMDGLEPRDPATTARDLVLLVHRWRRFPLLDPGLPSELLPADWPSSRAAARFRETHEAWQPIAAAWWREKDAEFSVGARLAT